MRKKAQWMIHWKWTTQHGVEAAAEPTPPGGRGWRLVSVASPAANLFVFYWQRRVSARTPMPTNLYPY